MIDKEYKLTDEQFEIIGGFLANSFRFFIYKHKIDWNLIMSIVNKLEKFEFASEFIIASGYVLVEKSGEIESNFEEIEVGVTSTKSEAVVNAIVEYINWLNKNNITSYEPSKGITNDQ